MNTSTDKLAQALRIPEGWQLVKSSRLAEIARLSEDPSEACYEGRGLYDERQVHANWSMCQSRLQSIKDEVQSVTSPWGHDSDELGEALDAQAEQPRNTETHEHLSTMIGLVLSARQRGGAYADGSATDKAVQAAIEHLKGWPYPEAAQAEQQAGPVAWQYRHPKHAPAWGPAGVRHPSLVKEGYEERALYTHPSPTEQDKVGAERLAWLHSPASSNVDGWEWGIFRVRWDEAGKAASVLHTCADFSDLDAARAKEQGA